MKRIADNRNAINVIVRETAQQGRNLLRAMEEFKFQVNQCSRVAPENSEAYNKIKQGVDMMDKIQSALYTVCYDLENFQTTPVYDNDQINMSEQDKPDSENEGYDLNEEFPFELPEESEADVDMDEDEEATDTGEDDFDFDMDDIENELESE